MDTLIIPLFKTISNFLISFLFTLLVFPLWYWVLLKYRLGKNIRTEGAPIFQSMHQKKAGTPTMAGLLIWLVPVFLGLFFLLLAKVNSFGEWINFVNRRETYLPLGFLAIAGILGAIDDLFGILKIGPLAGGIKLKEKLIIYLAIALLAGWWFVAKLGITFISIPFGERLYLGSIAFFLFLVFFILALSFSANETDGLDGLLAGVGLTAISALAVISFLNGNYNLASLSAMLLGSILAFLWFNIYPAKVFMGDTGSMAIGIFLAIVFLLEGIPFLALIILPVFVIEAGSVIIQTVSKKLFKRKIFLSTPIHHHFEALGNHESSIVFKFWVINAVGAILGFVIFVLDKYI
jgi:phospho-N-acetylmuramoyl-pentapeptide-transferase